MSEAYFLLAISQEMLKPLLCWYILLTDILDGASFEPIEVAQASYLLLEQPKTLGIFCNACERADV